MSLLTDLELVKTVTKADIESRFCDEFKEPYLVMDGSISKADYQRGTPLMTFRKRIKDVMDKTGFEYKLSLVGVYETCDAMRYEFAYSLVWYDEGLHQKSFSFGTGY